jgi:hypothetical protein
MVMLSLFVAAEGLLAWNEPLEDRSLQPHPTSSYLLTEEVGQELSNGRSTDQNIIGETLNFSEWLPGITTSSAVVRRTWCRLGVIAVIARSPNERKLAI